MIRIKIYNIIYNLPNFLLLVTNERKSKREWGEKDTKKIEDYEDSNFLKNIIMFETQGGLGGVIAKGSAPVSSRFCLAVSAVAVGSRFSRDP